MTGLQNAEFVSKADVRLRCILRFTVHYYVSCFLDHWLFGKKMICSGLPLSQ